MQRDRMEYLLCYTGVIWEEKLYVVHEGLGLLMEYDLRDFSYQVLTQIKLGEVRQHVRIKGMCLIEKVIYMVLENSWNVMEYHLDTGKLRVNGEDTDHKDGEELIEKIFRRRDELWLCPSHASQEILIFNFRTKQYRAADAIETVINKCAGAVDANCYADYATAGDGILYAIAYHSDCIVSIDMRSLEYLGYPIKRGKELSGITYDGKNYWLLFFDNHIARWNPKQGITEEYVIDGVTADNGEQPFRFVYEGEDEICIIPNYMPEMILLQKKTKEITRIQYSEEFVRIGSKARYQFYGNLIDDKKIFLFPYAVNRLVLLDRDLHTVKCIECILRKKDIEQYIIKEEAKTGKISEKHCFGIRDFVEYIERPDAKAEKEESRNSVGSRIYLRVKGEIGQ